MTTTVKSQRTFLEDSNGNSLGLDIKKGQPFIAPEGAYLDSSRGGYKNSILVGGAKVTLEFEGTASDPARWTVVD